MKHFYKNTKSKKYSFLLGLCAIGDGLVRILSFGFMCSSYQVYYIMKYAYTKPKSM